MTIVISFSSICLLLIIGKFLRVKLIFLQKMFIPSSIIGGILGLIILQSMGELIPSDFTAGWGKLPGFLINIVFASLFLGIKIPKISKIWQHAGSQLVYGQIVAWGQYVVGVGLSLFVLIHMFDIPKYLGVIVPVGFEGGHGTAGGLKDVFKGLGWSDGGDFALASATAGIVGAVIFGMILVNWAVRNKHTKSLKSIGKLKGDSINGIYNENERPVAGFQTVNPGSIDSLAFHLGLIGLAILIGYGIKQILGLTGNDVLQKFPLFPLSMIGGVILQLILTKFSKKNLIDHNLMQRLSGTALDFLVIAAIALISLPVILKGLVPFLIIVSGGILWNIFCVMFLAKRMLPGSWFERSIAEMGQSMGVTATGLLLLRVVDPKNETEAMSAFGYKQLLHEPFMGGGLWTSFAVIFAIEKGPLPVFYISVSAIIIWIIIWSIFFRKSIQRKQP